MQLPNFFRPSCLSDEARFLASHLCKRTRPTEMMKRGTLAEQISMRGTSAVLPEWTAIPAKLPENPATGKRFAKWDDWSASTGIDIDGEQVVKQSTIDQATAAAKAIRASLPDEFAWQVPGEVILPIEVPEGFSPRIVGTCDLLLEEAVVDIKVSTASDSALKWDYAMQLSAYAAMHGRSKVAILACFPLDDDELTWSTRWVEFEPLSIETVEIQCAKLVSAYNRVMSIRSSTEDISSPLKGIQ